jgi:uncharacterized protein DUF1566
MLKGVSLLLGLVMGLATPLLSIQSSQAADECGWVSRHNSGAIEVRRFARLAEHDGLAFIDMRTCLVWQLDVSANAQKSLDDAMIECASFGQGGQHGEMGWRIPTLSELTSVDSQDWTKQSSEFERFNIPVLKRKEIDFWTSTPWLGREDSLSAVQFSALTTIAHPITLDSKAAVWCVKGYLARGLR